ncbi:hypothetical protein ACC690_38460, partial [Rhizobium johnstonii]
TIGIRQQESLGFQDLTNQDFHSRRGHQGISDEEVRRFTPMHHEHDPATRVAIMTGEREDDPFKIQANECRDSRAAQGLEVRAS